MHPSARDAARTKQQQIRFSKQLSFNGNEKISSDAGPGFRFGSAPNFQTELNKIRNNFELRKSDSFFDKISDFFQPISRIMNPWK